MDTNDLKEHVRKLNQQQKAQEELRRQRALALIKRLREQNAKHRETQ